MSTPTPQAPDAAPPGPTYNLPALQRLEQTFNSWPRDIVWLGVKLGFGLTFGAIWALMLIGLLGRGLLALAHLF